MERRTYLHDDLNPDEPESQIELRLLVAGNDYWLQVASCHDAFAPMLRVRTSGSSDPRNLKVLMALQALWDALDGPTRPLGEILEARSEPGR